MLKLLLIDLNFLKYNFFRVVFCCHSKRQLAREHHEDCDSNAPDIALVRMLLASYYFRGHVVQGAGKSEERFHMLFVICLYGPSESEISQLY